MNKRFLLVLLIPVFLLPFVLYRIWGGVKIQEPSTNQVVLSAEEKERLKERELLKEIIDNTEIDTYTDPEKLPRTSKKVYVPKKLIELYSAKPVTVISFLHEYAKKELAENSFKALVFAVALVQSSEAAYPYSHFFDPADYDKRDMELAFTREKVVSIIEDLLKQIKEKPPTK